MTISYDIAPVGLIVERGAFSETMRPLIKYKIPIRLCGTFAFFFYYRSNEVVAKDNPLGGISDSEENPDFRPTALDHALPLMNLEVDSR